jgi:hypothetical protein
VRRAYREFVRTHHPDRGGDPEEFIAGLHRFHTELRAAGPGQARPREPGAAPVGVTVTTHRRGTAPVRLLRRLCTLRHRRRPLLRVQ